MRSARNPEVGGWLDDAWSVLKAASPVVNAIDAVKNAASKKEEAKKDAAATPAPGPRQDLEAQAKSGVPIWVWFALFYLISKKA